MFNRLLPGRVSPRSVPRLMPRGYLAGFALSNDIATPNSIIDIAAGMCRNSVDTIDLQLPAFTKTTGNPWVAGSGNAGGVGVVAINTWYHVFAISLSGAMDAYIDPSVTAANKPAGTTAFRRIGSIFTDGSAHIWAFTQVEDTVFWGANFTDFNASPADTNAHLMTLSTPLGVKTRPITRIIMPGASAEVIISSPDEQAAIPSTSTTTPPGFDLNGTNSSINVSPYLYTNASSQIRYQASGTPANIIVMTRGYIDSRGRFD